MSGLDSLKIEGRAKSAYYAAIVTGAYRHCLDDAAAGRHAGSGVAGRGGACEPPALFHRLLLRLPRASIMTNSRYIREWQVVALVTECDAAGNAAISLRQ